MFGSTIIDFSGDEGRQLLCKIAVKHTLPEYVQTCEIDSLETKQAGSNVAVITPRPALPCHTKAACWLSHAYYLEQRDSLDSLTQQKIERELRKQAAFWQIESDIESLVATEGSLIKQATESHEAYPVRNAKEAKLAADWLATKYHDGTFGDIQVHDRIELAGKLLDKQASLGYELSREHREMFARAAGRLGCFNGDKLAGLLGKIEHPFAKKMAAEARRLRGGDLQGLHGQLACACDKLAFFKEPAELAISQDPTITDYVVFPSGAVYATGDIASNKLARSLLVREPVIGEPSTEKLQKCAATVEPATLQQVEEILGEAGISPVAPGWIEPVHIDLESAIKEASFGSLVGNAYNQTTGALARGGNMVANNWKSRANNVYDRVMQTGRDIGTGVGTAIGTGMNAAQNAAGNAARAVGAGVSRAAGAVNGATAGAGAAARPAPPVGTAAGAGAAARPAPPVGTAAGAGAAARPAPPVGTAAGAGVAAAGAPSGPPVQSIAQAPAPGVRPAAPQPRQAPMAADQRTRVTSFDQLPPEFQARLRTLQAAGHHQNVTDEQAVESYNRQFVGTGRQLGRLSNRLSLSQNLPENIRTHLQQYQNQPAPAAQPQAVQQADFNAAFSNPANAGAAPQRPAPVAARPTPAVSQADFGSLFTNRANAGVSG